MAAWHFANCYIINFAKQDDPITHLNQQKIAIPKTRPASNNAFAISNPAKF